MPQKIAQLETLLFQYGEPIAIKKIAALLDVPAEECAGLVDAYAALLESEERGLTLFRNGGEVQLTTKSDYRGVLEKVIHDEFKEELTPAAVETASIIAYLGPIPRATIDYVRGVNSSFIIRNLLMRGLVERNQDEDRKHAYEYRITFDFLKHLGITRVEELPDYEKFKDILSRYESPIGEEKKEEIPGADVAPESPDVTAESNE
jgi:segregation and condensation protein B